MQDTFLTVEEAARRLSVSPYTLREWLKSGRLRGFQLAKRWRVPERALTELATAPAMPKATNEPEAEQPSEQHRRAAVSKARGAMKRPDYPHEVARFLEEKYADEARQVATSGAGAKIGAGA